MGQTLTNGIYLPNEGERNCYSGLAANWNAVDTLKGNYSLHAINVDIHVTAAEKETWNSKADNSALTAHTGDTTIHVTSADKQAWNGKADNSALTAHTGDTTIHVTAEDKAKWNGKQDALSQTQLDAVNSGIDSMKVQQIATNTSDISSLQSEKANDSDVVHKSGNETIRDTKTFGNGTLIVNNATGSNVHGEIKLNGSRPGYIVADNASDGVFNNNNCGVSILLQDAGKPVHIGGYKVDSNGRVFADNTNKKPVLSITSSLIKTSTLVPENDTVNPEFRILSQLDYANGNPSKVLDVRFIQYDDASGSSAIYSNDDNKTALGVSSRKWKDVQTYKVNNLEPGSLSLPSDRSARIDISSYFTNTGTGDTNTYTVPANGYIYLTLSELTNVHCFSRSSGNVTNYAQTFTKLSNSTDALYVLFPVRKNDVFVATWYTTTTVSVDGAFFIPCQGNI